MFWIFQLPESSNVADGILQKLASSEAPKSHMSIKRKSRASVSPGNTGDDAGKRNATPAPDFIEELYLALNPDVAEAIAAGKFASAWDHWAQFGRRETEEGVRPTLKHEMLYAEPEKKPATHESEAQFLDTRAYLHLNPDVRHTIGEEDDAVRKHWIEHGRFERRPSPGVAPFRRRHVDFCRMGARPFGFNVFGPFMAKTGLGTACRNMLAAIKETKLPFEIWNLDTSKGCARLAQIDKQRQPRFNINIIFANADQIEQVFLACPNRFFDDAYTIAVWQWELAAFRSDWFSAFGAVDEIWTNSRFQVESIRSVAPVPVIRINLPVVISHATGTLGRADLGIDPEAFVFLLPFDIGSTIARKNPMAGVLAFKAAFANDKKFTLIVKYQAPEHDKKFLLKLNKMIGSASNIHVISETLSETDMANLRSLSDCLLAPHRSEGFGLNIAEFMALGKPVIATNYAGSVDFLDQMTGYPVDFRLTEIENMTGPYPAGYVWAEPDQKSLIAQMLNVIQNPTEAAKRAARGAELIATEFNPARIAWDIIARVRKTELDRPLPLYARWVGHSHAISSPSPLRPFAVGKNKAAPTLRVTPLFSIIMPVYNVDGHFLERSIQSVLDQSYPFLGIMYCERRLNGD